MRLSGAQGAGQPQPYSEMCGEQARLYICESLLQAVHFGDRCAVVIHISYVFRLVRRIGILT